jgi:outer membrane protein assembly factor BamB
MRAKAVLAAAVLAMSTSGCWFQAGVGPNRTAFNDLETTITTANVNQLVHDWSAVLVDQTPAEPLVDNGVTYVRSAGKLSAFDLATGATRWSVPLGIVDTFSQAPPAVPAMAEGSLWVPTTTGQTCTLTQINPANGATVSTQVYDGLPPGSVPPSAVVFAQCGTGDALASASRVVVPSFSLAVTDPSAVPGANCAPGVSFERATARVSVFDLTDADQGWVLSQEVSGCIDSPPPTPPRFQPASASLSGDQILVAQAGVVSAYPLVPCSPGQPCPPAWSVNVGGQIVGPPVALSNGDVAIGRSDGQVVVIDGASHTVEWAASVGAQLAFPLAATPTSIYAVTNDTLTQTTVSALPAGGCGTTTCTPTWIAREASNTGSRLSIGGDVLYVTHGQQVSALAAAGCGVQVCHSLWTGQVGTTQLITSPAVIDNGEVLIGYKNGELAAFALPG